MGRSQDDGTELTRLVTSARLLRGTFDAMQSLLHQRRVRTRRLLLLGIALSAGVLGCGNADQGGRRPVGAAGNAAAGAGGTDGAGAHMGGAGAGGGPAADAGSGGARAGGGGRNDTMGLGGSAAGGSAGGTSPVYPLVMNDVTILAPLPPSSATSVLLRGSDLADDGTAFVPRVLFERMAAGRELGSSPVLNAEAYDRLHLIAVRFDLCDRHRPGPCPEAEDARMRLVFQPLLLNGLAEDAGLHAFYALRTDEIGGAIATLRELARSAPPQTGMLRISPALGAANPEAYATKLRAFVKRYGGDTRLVRLTMNAQPQIFAQVRWVFRGVEKQGDAFVDMPVVGGNASDLSESVILSGSSFDVMPSTDTPSGLLGAIQKTLFDAASAAQQRDYLSALAAVENPLTHTAETLACVACHVTTFVTSSRATDSSIDPLALPARYTSKFDLSTKAGESATTPSIRALGYTGRQPMISQRVVNDTAQTLAEIEQRYP